MTHNGTNLTFSGWTCTGCGAWIPRDQSHACPRDRHDLTPPGIASGVGAPTDGLNAEHIRRAERARIVAAVGRLPNWNALRLELPGDIVDHVRAAVLAAIEGEG